MAPVPWRTLQDPDNPQNHNAGNGGDLIKHSVYLTFARCLLAHEPWRSRAIVHECHAGRGIYRLAPERRALVDALLALDEPLARAQRAIVHELGATEGWYAGSALLLAHALGPRHVYHGYEWDPATRGILASALASLGAQAEVRIADAHQPTPFDGESHLAEQLAGFGPQAIVLLDPFDLWHHDKHAFRRARYRRILAAWRDRALPLALFWTWGRAHDQARAAREGRSRTGDGYTELAALLRGAERARVSVFWRWELSYAMWLVVPAPLLTELGAALESACHALFSALAPPDGEVEVRIEH